LTAVDTPVKKTTSATRAWNSSSKVAKRGEGLIAMGGNQNAMIKTMPSNTSNTIMNSRKILMPDAGGSALT